MQSFSLLLDAFLLQLPNVTVRRARAQELPFQKRQLTGSVATDVLAALWSDGMTTKVVSQGSVDSFVIRKHQREIVSQTNSSRLGGYA